MVRLYIVLIWFVNVKKRNKKNFVVLFIRRFFFLVYFCIVVYKIIIFFIFLILGWVKEDVFFVIYRFYDYSCILFIWNIIYVRIVLGDLCDENML